ncbi:hypothetical protein GVAV_002839 [Gurleya vavrai]
MKSELKKKMDNGNQNQNSNRSKLPKSFYSFEKEYNLNKTMRLSEDFDNNNDRNEKNFNNEEQNVNEPRPKKKFIRQKNDEVDFVEFGIIMLFFCSIHNIKYHI